MAGYKITGHGENNADLTLFQGKTISMDFVWGGDTPIDVTGFQALLQIRASAKASRVIEEFTVANGRVSIGDTNGEIGLHMTAADSSNLPAPFEGVYEMVIISASGARDRAMYGDLFIEEGVVR